MKSTTSILPTLTMSRNYLSVRRYLSNDAFVAWLRSLPWDMRQRARIDMVLNAYYISHSKDDKTIFWLIDEKQNIRDGKMVDFGNEGKVSWIHENIQKAGIFDPAKYQVRHTLFGMHLLDKHPKATVNIVETEQEAILGAIFYGNLNTDIWMALGNPDALNKEMLKPIIDRKHSMYFYTCQDNFDNWQQRINALEYPLTALMEVFVTKNAPRANANIAEMFIEMLYKQLLKPQTADDIIKEMAQRNPELNRLIDKLQLTPTNDAEEEYR